MWQYVVVRKKIIHVTLGSGWCDVYHQVASHLPSCSTMDVMDIF